MSFAIASYAITLGVLALYGWSLARERARLRGPEAGTRGREAEGR